MSLKDIRSECSDVASLLQPYVDGELASEEQERAAHHVEGCDPCRSAVQEQLWIRATLRAIERDRAPRALRARILQSLEEVDRETEAAAEHASPPGAWARAWSRLRDVFRGGLVMVPAGAVAVALFYVARSGVSPTDPMAPPASAGLGAALTASAPRHEAAPDEDVLDAIADVEPKVGFPVQVATPGTSNAVQLVGARVDAGTAPNAQRPGARLRYKVLWEGKPTHVVDHQLPIGFQELEGTPVTFGGRQYHLGRREDGSPVLWFERSGVAHMLMHEAPAGALAARHRRPSEGEGDYSLLLHFADHSFSR